MAQVKKAIAAVALAAMGMAAPAGAASHCWAPREASAAQVRDLQTMLMVAALRCRAAHIDISADYDGFVIAQKDAITAANLVIKRHFADEGGAQADYDRFATSLANGFGDDATTEATCAEAAALAHDASAAGPGALDPVAARVFPASLPGGTCEGPAVTIAVAVPSKSTALPPIVALVTPPPADPAPVTLPADVAAALIVMARYNAGTDMHAPGPVVLAASR